MSDSALWHSGLASRLSEDATPVVLGTRLLRCGRTLWVELQGVLNWRTTDSFWQHLDAALTRPCRRIVLDLTHVEYVGGNGLRALSKLQEDLGARGIEFRIVVPEGSRCARTIAMARLHGLLPTFAHPSHAWRHRNRTGRSAVPVPADDAALPAYSAVEHARVPVKEPALAS
jgi:anti-anti-sigma factor